MQETFHTHMSYINNKYFKDWMQDAYDMDTMILMANELTDTSIQDFPKIWYDSYYFGQEVNNRITWNKLVKRVYKKYREEIWTLCIYRAFSKKYRNKEITRDNTILGFGRLDLADQVNSPENFEEMMVRNAMKMIANQIIHGGYNGRFSYKNELYKQG